MKAKAKQIVIRPRSEDGHDYVEVLSGNTRLFACGSAEIAERILREDHDQLVATCWQEPTKAPELNIQIAT